jgi:hypothetical protein
LAAFVLVAGSYGGFTTTNVHAGALPADDDFTVSVDCDTSTGAIDSACLYSAGTTSVTADVYLTNNSGGAAQIASFNATLSAVQQFFVPVVPGSCTAPKLNCNPDFNEGLSGTGWSCDPALADQNVDPTVADSLISCLNPNADGTPIANGATVRLFRVSYTTVNGVSPLTLNAVFVADEQVTELGSCNPLLTTAAICNNATVTIGGAVATSTSTPSPTATPNQFATATPCPGVCPTATRLGFSTVTPIVTPSVVPAATTAASDVPPPPPPPPAPDGTTGGAGSRPIRLPDTGEGNDGGAGTWLTILAAITAVGVAGIASGAWFNARRRSEED